MPISRRLREVCFFMVCRPRCTSRQGLFLLCPERFSQCPWRKAAHATPPMYGKYWNNSRRISLTLWPKSERCSWSRWAWMWRKLKFSSWMQEPKIRKRQDCLLNESASGDSLGGSNCEMRHFLDQTIRPKSSRISCFLPEQPCTKYLSHPLAPSII